MSNILIVANSIPSPIDALSLVIDSIGRLPQASCPSLKLSLLQVASQFPRKYLKLAINRIELGQTHLSSFVYQYNYIPSNVWFDIKNGLFRLGKEILIAETTNNNEMI